MPIIPPVRRLSRRRSPNHSRIIRQLHHHHRQRLRIMISVLSQTQRDKIRQRDKIPRTMFLPVGRVRLVPLHCILIRLQTRRVRPLKTTLNPRSHRRKIRLHRNLILAIRIRNRAMPEQTSSRIREIGWRDFDVPFWTFIEGLVYEVQVMYVRFWSKFWCSQVVYYPKKMWSKVVVQLKVVFKKNITQWKYRFIYFFVNFFFISVLFSSFQFYRFLIAKIF